MSTAYKNHKKWTGQADPHHKNIILIRNIRKTRNISNHEKHNIIIRNIRNANTTNVTLGFSSIVPPRTFKNTGV